jgi:hypothetical protein
MATDHASTAFVLLDFYDGSYGPTLRIDIPSRELLETFRGALQRLAEKRTNEMRLTDADFIRAGNVVALDLVLQEQPKKQHRSKTLQLHQGARFLWSNSADGWQHCVDLLDGFTEQPGHQYLTAERVDDALIEVAYLER